jgi:hypothetical protein
MNEGSSRLGGTVREIVRSEFTTRFGMPPSDEDALVLCEGYVREHLPGAAARLDRHEFRATFFRNALLPLALWCVALVVRGAIDIGTESLPVGKSPPPTSLPGMSQAESAQFMAAMEPWMGGKTAPGGIPGGIAKVLLGLLALYLLSRLKPLLIEVWESATREQVREIAVSFSIATRGRGPDVLRAHPAAVAATPSRSPEPVPVA